MQERRIWKVAGRAWPGDHDSMRARCRGISGLPHYAFEPFAIIPIWDNGGQVAIGVFEDGAARRCAVAGTLRCVRLGWPNSWFAYVRPNHRANSWHGSLLRDRQDEAGVHYRRNRYYDPQTGRFTQEDPIGLAGGLNLYGYAGGDPVNFSDPFGLCPNITVEGNNGSIEAKMVFHGVAAADATRIRTANERSWGRSMHGYSISINLNSSDAPEVEVWVDQGRLGGVGGSHGRGAGGQMLVGMAGGLTTMRAVASHEFGHVMGLGHSDRPQDLMHPVYAGGHRITREQLEQAIENCRNDRTPEEESPSSEDTK